MGPVNIVSVIEEFPPVLCRLLCRDKSNRQLAKELGVSRSWVDRLSVRTSWLAEPRVSAYDMFAFMFVCGVDPLHARRHREFIRRGNWRHLTTGYQRRLLRTLCRV